MSVAAHDPEQSMVEPQPSSKVAEQLPDDAHVSGVHPQTPPSASHGPFAQSESALHARPGAHPEQFAPPQSTSDSVSFLMPSEQGSVLVPLLTQVVPLLT
jgi:hypothetical protein